MWIDGREWKLVPVEPTPDWIANLSDKGLRIGKLESAIEDMLDAAPTLPAQGDDCDDVDAILRIVGLDPERCRTEGGALNVGRTRTLWEDVVSPAAQPAAASPDFPHYEMAFICRVLEGDHPEKADLDTALGMARSVRVALLKERAAQAPAANEDALDAARYRFVRDVPYTDEIRNVMALQQNAIMDETIDAAMQRTTGSEE